MTQSKWNSVLRFCLSLLVVNLIDNYQTTMTQVPPKGLKFTEQAKALILEHLSDESFGVSELANAMHMSRSNLLRKCKKQTNLSASLFIRQIRLEQALELIKDSEMTISEVSYQVGFGNTSYFIKCFKEQYGVTPGEVDKLTLENLQNIEIEKEPVSPSFISANKWPIIISILGLAIIVSFLIPSNFKEKGKEQTSTNKIDIEKSIAVLPFKNESNDSTNLYFVNGLMEAALGNLQKIGTLRVISRTSVEKYRHSNKNIGEIASELNVNYIVEGSGQKIDEQVLLNIQLIDAATDTQLWGEQYSYKIVDIFAVQNEVAKSIADAIEANITPSELEQIDKKPTNNLVAYDYYLQAQEPFNRGTSEGLLEAISLFEKALEEDPKFALVYADLAIAYYYLDWFKKEKQYTELINNYADKALLYDSELTESLIAKALYYEHKGEYRLALPHLEKALEYNPNSSAVLQLLSDLYANYIPNTDKYLEYALKGIQLDIAANDSIGKSYIYLHLSNALIQSGFTDEALNYINKSVNFFPDNPYAPYLRAYIQYSQNKDITATLKAIKNELQKDATRLDILQEVAKLHYFQKDYNSAYYYYRQFDSIRQSRGLAIYPQEDIKIGFVYKQLGYDEEASRLFDSYATYCEQDASIYKDASLAVKYAHNGNSDLAIKHLQQFSTQDHYQYWMVLFMRLDPILQTLEHLPEYRSVMKKIDDKFWANHEELKTNLTGKGLL